MDFGALFTELLGIIRATWPEIPSLDATPKQVWTSVQALRQSFVSGLNDGELALPAVVVRIGSETHDTTWGVRSRVYRPVVGVYYIAPEGTKQTTIHGKLSALRDAILAADRAGALTSFQHPPEYPTLDSSEDSDVNRNLVANGAKVASGSIEWPTGLICTL